MGRGDVKTAKGKRFRSSFGKSRPRKAGTNLTIPINETKTTTNAVKKTTTKKTEEKPVAKKKTTKKTEAKPAAKKEEKDKAKPKAKAKKEEK